MIRVFAAAAVAIAIAGLASVATAADAALVEKGKAVFDGAKPACKACHNEKKNALDNYGATGTAVDVKAWLRTPKEMLVKNARRARSPPSVPTGSPTRTSMRWPRTS